MRVYIMIFKIMRIFFLDESQEGLKQNTSKTQDVRKTQDQKP